MSSYDELTAARIAFHEEQLRGIARQTSSLQEKLSSTPHDATQPCVQEVIDTLRIDIRDLANQASSIRNTIAYLRLRLNPRVLHSFPTELLVTIFEELCTARSNVYAGFRCIAPYDILRAEAPFVLASVCRRWRQLALNTPWLWTYVGLGPYSSDAQWRCVRQYFDLCFTRSRDEPLEICLDLADAPDSRWFAMSGMLGILGAMSARWRIMLCGLPGAMIMDHSFPAELERLFLGETPLLEEIVACIDDHAVVNPWNSHTKFPRYLPRCPRLRAMRTDGCHIICTAPHAVLGALVHLELQVSLPPTVIWHMLQLAPGLEHLDLDITGEPSDLWKHEWTASAPAAVHLAALRSLFVSGWAHELFALWGSALTMPNLQKLVALELFTNEVLPIVAQCSRAVRVLHWQPSARTELQEIDAACLGEFANVDELIIYENISPEFMASATRDNLWPKLETLLFRHGDPAIEATDALLEFVRARRQAGESTTRLKSVTFDDYMIPSGLDEQINDLLRNDA
ncbi:hypothetical protein AURDEDRAFT_171659 [Auricularia subglabra TFB-10046 SS5]|nr:hypothetical protein AURDEDRAFT_171659 [Auricularia subglabra TFB-10046 SS5]